MLKNEHRKEFEWFLEKLLNLKYDKLCPCCHNTRSRIEERLEYIKNEEKEGLKWLKNSKKAIELL